MTPWQPYRPAWRDNFWQSLPLVLVIVAVVAVSALLVWNVLQNAMRAVVR